MPPDRRDYSMRTMQLLSPWDFIRPLPRKVNRPLPHILNQEETGICVGTGYVGLRLGPPFSDKRLTRKDAEKLYCISRRIGYGETDCDLQAGSHVRAGALAAREMGYIRSFALTKSVNTLIRHVLRYNGVVVGIPWTEGMFEPVTIYGHYGFVKPTGNVVGGHAFYVCGVDTTMIPGEDVIIAANSWGTEWGDKGYFKFLKSDLVKLFSIWGHACTAVESPVKARLMRIAAKARL